MFEHHRKSPWFAEKYDPSPEFVQLRARVRKEGWRGHLNAFLADIETGKYDPDLNEPELAPLSPSVKQESTTNGETALANGLDSACATLEDTKPVVSTDDAMQFNVEPDDEGGEQDSGRGDINANGRQNLDSKRPADRGEEISIPPEGNQVMIRTIPPDIGRVKLEEVSSLRFHVPEPGELT
jgi:hypothetical protein